MQAQAGEGPLGYRPAKTAEMLGCKERTIYRYLKDGKLRAKRVAGITLITAESLAELIAQSPDWAPQSEQVAAA